MDATTLARCTGASLERAATYAHALGHAMEIYQINTPARIGMFLANIGHETMGLRYTVEIWGPTDTQKRYDGRADLGNNKAGDGLRFRGRGMLQTTGRANYQKLTARLKARLPDEVVPDFTVSPELVAAPKWASISAADYWDMRRLNELADRGAFVDVVKKINGGTNGLQERFALWTAAQGVLS